MNRRWWFRVLVIGTVVSAGVGLAPGFAMSPLAEDEMAGVVGGSDDRKCEGFQCADSACLWDDVLQSYKIRLTTGATNHVCRGTGGNGCHYEDEPKTLCGGWWTYESDPTCTSIGVFLTNYYLMACKNY